LVTSLLAAYQVVMGIEGLEGMAVTNYTIGFGVLLIAALLILNMGFDVLDSPIVVIVSTLIPLSLSLGLVAEFVARYTLPYLVFVLVGFVAIIVSRYVAPGLIATVVLALFHGIAGMVIFLLPLILSLNGTAPLGFAWVGVGGGLIGAGGLPLSFLKAGSPILSRDTILSIFPALLLLTTAAFVAGFAFL
jgi:hypothetical protein